MWLEGDDLPRLDNSTEGHAWLLLAVKDNSQLADALASVAALLLCSFAKQDLRSANIDRLLFNLFYLCHGLKRPSVLWEPLKAILDKRLVPAKSLKENSGH